MYESVKPFKGYKYLHFSCPQLMSSAAHTTKCPQLSIERVVNVFHRPQNGGRQIYWQPERNIEQWLLRPTFKEAQDYFYRDHCDHFTYPMRAICRSCISRNGACPSSELWCIQRTTSHLPPTTKRKCQFFLIWRGTPVVKLSSIQFSAV